MTMVESNPPLGILRGAFEATGSPSWIMRTIRHHGLDKRHGFILELNLGGDVVRHSLQATEALLAQGAADVIDTDWLSIARWRRDGFAVKAVFPYGRIMGGIVVPDGSSIFDLADLRGRRFGVVRKVDKNWLVVRAACMQRHSFDPQNEAEVAEAKSKTVLLDWIKQGLVDAAVLYWHLVPELTSGGGFRQLHDVLDLVSAISGLNPPTTFFVCREEFIVGKRELVRAFIAAYRDAVAVMRGDDRVWSEAVGCMNHGDTELIRALRTSWDRRVCTRWTPEDFAALIALFDCLKRIGGIDSLGGVEAISPEMFSSAFAN